MSKGATKEELEAGRGYEALFVPALFAPWTHHLIRGARVADGQSLLDVACGSGVLTRDVRSRTGPAGRVVGLDPAPGMIAAASEIEPDIEWVSGAAEDLPFEDGTFDCVVSQFGMMFFQDKAAACAEMLRVLRPGGRLTIGTWQPIGRNPAYQDIVTVLDAEVGREAGDAVRLPFVLGDEDELRGMFAEAGFDDIAIRMKSEQARFPSAQMMVEVELRGWLPLFGINLGEEKIAEVLGEAGKRLAKYAASSGEAVFPTSALILTASKPA